MNKLIQLFIDVFFTPLCVICGKYIDIREGVVCDACFNAFIIKRYPEKFGSLDLMAATDYQDRNIKKLLYLLKYNQMKIVSLTLGKLLAKRLSMEQDIDLKNTIIIPLPLHPKKERKRGYNQSELIAQSAGSILKIKVLSNALRRIKQGEPQAMIEDYKERARNINGVFVAGKENGVVFGKTVILIDDILTSGSTMKEAIKEIRKMKPKRIIPAVVARAKS